MRLSLLQASLRHLGTPRDLTFEHLSAGLPDRAFFLLGKSNPLRRSVIYLVRSKFFEWFILGSILANCVIMAMQANNKPGFAESHT